MTTPRRPIRVLIAKPGLDGHDVGAKLVCRALRDAGMEVIYTGLRKSPESIVAAALEEDVAVLGLSILSGAHLPICRKIREKLKSEKMLGEVVWLVGGNIPRKDTEALQALGVAHVFGVGADFDEIVDTIHEAVGS